MKRAILLAMLVVACGATNSVASQRRALWSAPPPAGDPRTDNFGTTAISAAQAMLDAATKPSHDPRWDCVDPATDLRGTPDDVKTRLAALGALSRKADLMMVAVVMTFDSPAGSFDPNDVVDVRNATTPPRVFFHANALVGPDAMVSWTQAHAYLAALEEPNDDRASVGDLVDPLKGDLKRLIDGAASEACNVPIANENDLDALPYELDRDTRQTFLAGFDSERRKLPKTCKAVGQGAGPWEVHFSHVEAGFRAGSFVAKLRSQMRITGGTPCLGPVEVPVSGSESQ
jgi:hypothetical protein